MASRAMKSAPRGRARVVAPKKTAAAKKSVTKKAAKKTPAQVAEAKAAAQAAAQVAVEEVLKKLEPKAKDINARLDAATVQDRKADDKRLSAAKILAEAKALADDVKLSFRDWCESHLHITLVDGTQKPISYEEARKLAAVGAAENPAQALADLRSGAAERNRKARAKAKVEKGKASSVSRDTGTRQITQPPVERAISAFDLMEPAIKTNLIKSQAEQLGMRLVSNDEAKIAENVQKSSGALAGTGLDAMKSGFDSLKPTERMEFVRWAAGKVGAKITTGFETAEGDDFDVPPALRRKK